MEITYQLDQIGKVAKKLSKMFRPGDIVGFSGDLAAGKTTLIAEIVKNFGYTELVNSPTYVIEHRYSINNDHLEEIIHLDFYRLKAEDLAVLDWLEYIDAPKKLTLIEWPELADLHLPKRTKKITIKKIDEKTRKLVL